MQLSRACSNPVLKAGVLRLQSRPCCVSYASGAAQGVAQGSDVLPAIQFIVAATDVAGKGKVRLDAFLSAQLPEVSRAKVTASIKAGLVQVDGASQLKPAYAVKQGERISCALLPPEPCTALPEAIPLDVVYEDDHLLVVNKAPGMVVHLSPGHARGTLVNALLAHCGLPALEGSSSSGGGSGSSSGGLLGYVLGQGAAGSAGSSSVDDSGSLDEWEEEEGEEGGGGWLTSERLEGQVHSPPGGANSSSSSGGSSGSSGSGGSGGGRGGWGAGGGGAPGVLRPGIVHRLDKGTSGLMVVAKTDLSHMRLCEQFKARTVSRIYHALTQGVPPGPSGRIATNIVRDPTNRLRMAAAAYGSARGKTAASNYRVLAHLAGGAAALVEWRLETGRTHQIRVHAKHTGCPLLGDDTYGPGNATAARTLAGRRTSQVGAAKALLDTFGRPALHALTLGFAHPVSGARLEFRSEHPPDFAALLAALRDTSGGGGGGEG